MKNRRNLQQIKFMGMVLAVVFCLVLPLAGHAAADGPGPEVTATPISMDFYGFIASARPGDIVTVQDADGVVCGAFAVKTDGRYGFVHVYGDDPTTVADEGATRGDKLTFLLNGKPLPGDVIWSGDGRREQADFPDQR
ncbi:MAG: hypothetical protein GXP53_09565 [Deltaproteobacteria bacterium]|nr:hypothetical protein [Deltaproteobacteria bacterium]